MHEGYGYRLMAVNVRFVWSPIWHMCFAALVVAEVEASSDNSGDWNALCVLEW